MGEVGISNKVIWFAPNVIPDGFGRQELHSHNSIESSKYNLVFREYFLCPGSVITVNFLTLCQRRKLGFSTQNGACDTMQLFNVAVNWG